MKWHVLLLLILFVLPCVNAGYLEIESVRAYVNEERINNVDRDGGDIEDVMPSDILEFRIDIKNNDPNDSLIDVLVFGEIQDIDDGQDMDLDLSRFTLRKLTSERKILSFTIPSDAEDDDYDVKLAIRAITNNGSEEFFNASYNLEVVRTSSTAFDIRGAIVNLTSICTLSYNQSEYVRNRIDSAVGQNSELSGCKNNYDVKVAEYNALVSDKNSLQLSYEGVVAEKDKYVNDYNSLRADFESCNSNFNSTVSKLNKDVDSLKKSNRNTIYFIGAVILGIVAFVEYNRRKGNFSILMGEDKGVHGDGTKTGIGGYI